MWNRKELKARGKQAFRANYWRSVLVALLVVFVIGSAGAAGSKGVDSGMDQSEDAANEQIQSLNDAIAELPDEVISQLPDEAIDQLPDEVIGQLPDGLADLLPSQSSGAPSLLSGVVIGAIIGAIAIAMLLFTFIDALLLNPLEVGCRRFFLVNSREEARLKELVFGYENNYWNTVKTILLRDIFAFLWTLLFLIPGIVKAYSYRLVPYIIADDPTVPARDAITISRQMMKGHKWRTFVLDLSFIGWDILSVLTLGLVGIFYANPYQCATDAELYRAIRSEFER